MALYRNSWFIFFMLLCTSVVYGEIMTNCRDEITVNVGDSHNLTCNGIPFNITNGIRVFHDGDVIISCNNDNKSCASTDPDRYIVESPHTDVLNFKISSVKLNDAGKYICVDSATQPNEQSEYCSLSVLKGGLDDGEIAGIIIGSIVILLFVVLISYALFMKKCVIPKRGG